jgi:hypothetical protein
MKKKKKKRRLNSKERERGESNPRPKKQKEKKKKKMILLGRLGLKHMGPNFINFYFYFYFSNFHLHGIIIISGSIWFFFTFGCRRLGESGWYLLQILRKCHTASSLQSRSSYSSSMELQHDQILHQRSDQ